MRQLLPYSRWFGSCLIFLLAALPAWASSSDTSPASCSESTCPLLAQAPLPADPGAGPLPAAPQLLPGMAATLALAPGVLVHGSGHFYAQRPITGTVLLLLEGAAIYMAYRGGTELLNASGNFDIVQTGGESGQISYGLGLAAGGVMLFLASWFYDLTGAPIAAEEMNAGRRSAPTGPTVITEPTGDGLRIALRQSF